MDWQAAPTLVPSLIITFLLALIAWTIQQHRLQKQQQISLEAVRQQAESAMQVVEVAQAKVEAATQAKNSFLNTMSHEVRTPLGAVVGMANLLRDTPLNSEQKELVDTIITNSDALLAVINNVLEYSKIEANDLELDVQPFDLRDTIKISLKPYSAAANQKSISFHYHISDSVPNIFYGDPVRLRQILSNLLSNAIKYTNVGEINVSVTNKLLTNEKVELLFSVKDTGIGIPKSYTTHLFHAFSQADSYMTRKYGGSGLGLAISKRLCELMGGRIWAESEEGEGSTFFFTAVFEKSQHPPIRYLQPQTPTLRGKKLLIVAPNAEHRRIISREIRSAGMLPYVAGSIAEVSYWLKGSAFDAALIDSQLLGSQTAKLISQIYDQAPLLPQILLATPKTAAAFTKDERIAAFLSQPFAASNLYEILFTVFATKRVKQTKQNLPASQFNEMGKRHPLQVLMVEDNLINQKVASRLLQRLGYQIDIAHNGREGVHALEQKRYDVVLMDIQMPIMDGVEATRYIRKNFDKTRQPHIIAVTAHALEGDKEGYLAAGMDDYISKPMQLDALVSALHRCLPLSQQNNH